MCVWVRDKNMDPPWRKLGPLEANVPIELPAGTATTTFGRTELTTALAKLVGSDGLVAEIQIDLEASREGRPELVIQLVNQSPAKHPTLRDTNLYEVSLRIEGLTTRPFVLEALPDSFRYDRRIPAYGVNVGIQSNAHNYTTTDGWVVDRFRPTFWSEDEEPDLRFATLAANPIPSLEQLVTALRDWGERTWSDEGLKQRASTDDWDSEMLAQAKAESKDFEQELERVTLGVREIRDNAQLQQSFRLMNQAFLHSARGYDAWRAFQIGFLLANINSVIDPNHDAETADIVWFATGGGKTETYLGLIVLAALYDRVQGRSSGITAWSRFPLRMLSLQQTQRFANAMAGAERVRQEAGLEGDPFGVGFLVGRAATPNSISLEPKEGDFNPDDDTEAARYQVLLTCPFCGSQTIEMGFNRRKWRLEHRCAETDCWWKESALPFYIVDDEVYRFLPTVVVGTLDKAALISFQASMRGLVGPPYGICSEPGHGYVYAPRKSRPHGCLVPGCRGRKEPLPQPAEAFAPRFRLQDELHLLKDSLGAVDAHYESLLDTLQRDLVGTSPKVLASSATLAGFQQQARVLYDRQARAFPVPPPTAGDGFWMSTTQALQRRFVGVAPRGTTIEYATDRLLGDLQNAVRKLITEPDTVCESAGIDKKWAPELLSLYGVDVVYGNTIRDLDAVARSIESQQVHVTGTKDAEAPSLNTASLTGRTDFEEVRQTLQRLEQPEKEFEDRVHVITASSMMSHGVDIDRLNVMVMLGLPLTTSEFIQTTARVGRRWPGLVIVLHKIARERDASVFRSFPSFVTQGDRFVEPVPVTRRSRRVLERTIAGLMLARILAIHEPSSGTGLTTVSRLRTYFNEAEIDAEMEIDALIRILNIDDSLDDPLKEDLARWVQGFFRNLNDPGGTFTFPSDLCPLGPPMMSLRDVEEQALVRN